MAFGNAEELIGLVREKTGKKIVAKRGEVNADVVKVTAVSDALYTIDYGDQRRRLLIAFARQQLEDDDSVRFAKEDISFPETSSIDAEAAVETRMAVGVVIEPSRVENLHYFTLFHCMGTSEV